MASFKRLNNAVRSILPVKYCSIINVAIGHAHVAPNPAFSTLKYFANRVTVPGLKIVSYDSYNNPTVADALGNTAKCYRMSLDPAEAPIGSKITVVAVASWYNGFQFVGDAENLTVVPGPKKDTYAYPVRQEKYTLTNNWIVSNLEDNFAANLF